MVADLNRRLKWWRHQLHDLPINKTTAAATRFYQQVSSETAADGAASCTSGQAGVSCRVGSANFSRRKIVHAHDYSAASENVAGAREQSVHAHFIFRFKNGQGNRSFFLSMTKIQMKRVNCKLSRPTVDAPSTGRFREASSGPEKSLVPHGLVEKQR